MAVGGTAIDVTAVDRRLMLWAATCETFPLVRGAIVICNPLTTRWVDRIRQSANARPQPSVFSVLTKDNSWNHGMRGTTRKWISGR